MAKLRLTKAIPKTVLRPTERRRQFFFISGKPPGTPAQLAREISKAGRRTSSAQSRRILEEALRKQAEAEAKRLAEEKARQEAKRIEQQRLSEIKRIQQKKLSQIRRAKTLRQKRRIIKRRASEIRRVTLEAAKIKKELKGLPGKVPEVKQKIIEKLEKKTPRQRTIELIKPSPETKLLSAIVVGESLVENFIAFKELPKTAKAIVQNPALLKSVPQAIKQETREFGRLTKVSPTSALARIGTEIVLLKGTAKGFKIAGQAANLASARLSTKFVGKAKVGTKLTVVTQAGKKVDLDVVGKIGSKGLPRETLKKQIGRAGKKVTGISAQADELVGFVKRKRIIRKPIMGEEKFSSATKKLLNKFDESRITKKELIKLDKAIQKESGKGILERSFFVDPEARIRPSRLGIEREADISDILKGEATFKKQKPQILLFADAQVEKLPKNLKKVGKKIAKNKPLTKTESDAFLRFQLKKSGKFKPLGFASGEPEITLAPGEIIKRQKKVGVTIINGRKVPIVEAKAIKPSKKLNKLLTKFKRGTKLTREEKKQLNRLFKKETGTKLKVSSPKVSRKTVPVKRIGFSSLTRVAPRISRPSRPVRISRIPKRPSRVSKPSRPSKPKKPSKVSKPSRPSRLKRPLKVSKPSKPSRPSKLGKPGKPGKVARIKISKIKKKKKKIKPVPVFNVFGKSRGKFVKLNVKPLTRDDALSRGAFAVDRTTAKTFKIVPAGKTKKPGALLKKERNYFNRQGFKLREFRIKKGRKFKLRNKYIEKRKFGIDTRSEKQGLTIAKLLKQRKIKRVVQKKRKITSAQRKALIQRLKKARKVRMQKLKGGKK